MFGAKQSWKIHRSDEALRLAQRDDASSLPERLAHRLLNEHGGAVGQRVEHGEHGARRHGEIEYDVRLRRELRERRVS